MSKMNKLAMELEEQASELGFESLEQAEQAGYEVDYENAKLIEPQEAAHKAWLKERDEVLHLLESVKEEIINLNGGDNNHVAIDELDYVIDFVEKGEC